MRMPPIEPALSNLFVYGSLVDPPRLDDVLGRRFTGERLRARLSGFRRISSTAYPYPFIVEAPGKVVDGMLILGLDAQDLEKLDEYEEVAAEVYSRAVVEVEAWGCGPRPMPFRACTYVGGTMLLRVTGSAAPSTTW